MFQRYAIYFTPSGDLAKVGSAWLGWDIARGAAVAHPMIKGLDPAHLTNRPRKYGFHGTIKAPFFLAEGMTQDMLVDAVGRFCARQAAVRLDALKVHAVASFIALVPAGDQGDLRRLANKTVETLDVFRAPPSPAELARRRQARLTPTQEANLKNWGYPYVMEEFRFHITLTGRIKGNMDPVITALRAHFTPHLPTPCDIDSLTLVGEDDAGMFHEIRRFALAG